MSEPENDPIGRLGLPPGFRFYPTDEELLVQYLCRKVAGHEFSLRIIGDIDLYKFDPWDLPSKAVFGEKEWYFFSPRDRKYPNGTRPNRVAGSGYWKATGTDKVIATQKVKVGIKKALVFYTGKAPRGTKTNWIMHEYRLFDSPRSAIASKLDDWVLCRIYKKNTNASVASTNEHSPGGSSASSATSHLDEALHTSPAARGLIRQENNDQNVVDYGSVSWDWNVLAGLTAGPDGPNQAQGGHVINDGNGTCMPSFPPLCRDDGGCFDQNPNMTWAYTYPDSVDPFGIRYPVNMESTDYSMSGGGGGGGPLPPPGFRFHPTDEELVVHYLKKKAQSSPIPVSIIAEVDIYKFDPWELPAKAAFGEQEWYFFSPRERKYPNGTRPNRAATSGYWKATGTDKPVMTSSGRAKEKIGLKKALVFYGGKPPRGVKTDWIMHEYRLADNKPTNYDPTKSRGSTSLRLDDWVLCRIYKKNSNKQMHDESEDFINHHNQHAHNLFDGMLEPTTSSLNAAATGSCLRVKRNLPSVWWDDDEAATRIKRSVVIGADHNEQSALMADHWNSSSTSMAGGAGGDPIPASSMLGPLPCQLSGLNWIWSKRKKG
ncbi:hypothetical protein V2J09_019690 [Rumex salicifolius]